MRVGILSDSHDNIWNLKKALKALSVADAVIHCGDLCSPFIIQHLSEGLAGIPIHIVWGNNDGDQRAITELAKKNSLIRLHGDFAELELEGSKIAVTHYPQIAMALSNSDSYDVVCYGHDHIAHEEMVGKTLLINPGEVMGMNGKCSVALASLPSQSVEWITIK